MMFKQIDQTWTITRTLCCIAASAVLFPLALAQANNDGNVDVAGLKVQWRAHTGSGLQGGLVDWYLNIDENKSTTFFTISGENYSETFSQHDRNAAGQVMGVDGGLSYAEIRQEIVSAELTARTGKPVQAKVSQYALPKSTLYTLTSDSYVQAIDADTGKTLWRTQVGDPSRKSIGIGASADYVAAVNGTTVYCLGAETGKVVWSKKCRSIVSASPTVEDDEIYVPLFNGRLEKFSIEDKGFNSQAFVAKGESTTRPNVTELAVAWANSNGDMNVGGRFDEKISLAYQLRTDKPIVATPAYKDGVFFVTSLDGFVYALTEKTGTLAWQVSTGVSISKSPIALGNDIFVINDKNELYKLNAKTGYPVDGWVQQKKGIEKFIGAGKSNLYVLDVQGNLKVLNQATGNLVAAVPFGNIEAILPNTKSDRLYVTDSTGTIQCIRELASNKPFFHSDEFVPEAKAAPEAAKANPTADAENPFGEANPFGDAPAADSENPFGDAKAKEADDADPFK